MNKPVPLCAWCGQPGTYWFGAIAEDEATPPQVFCIADFDALLADMLEVVPLDSVGAQMGRWGGKKGGVASAAKLTAAERIARARKAAQTRWARHRDKSPIDIDLNTLAARIVGESTSARHAPEDG